MGKCDFCGSEKDVSKMKSSDLMKCQRCHFNYGDFPITGSVCGLWFFWKENDIGNSSNRLLIQLLNDPVHGPELMKCLEPERLVELDWEMSNV